MLHVPRNSPSPLGGSVNLPWSSPATRRSMRCHIPWNSPPVRVSLNRHCPSSAATELFRYPHRAARTTVTLPASGCGRSLETSAATASAVGHGSIVYSVPVSTSCVTGGAGVAVVPTIATAPAVRHSAPTMASAQTIPPNLVISPSSILPFFRDLSFLPSCPPNIGRRATSPAVPSLGPGSRPPWRTPRWPPGSRAR